MCDKMLSNESNHYGCTGCEICRIPQPDFACRITDAGFRNSFCGISDGIHKRYSLPNLVWITGGAPNFTGIGRAVSKRQTTHGTGGTGHNIGPAFLSGAISWYTIEKCRGSVRRLPFRKGSTDSSQILCRSVQPIDFDRSRATCCRLMLPAASSVCRS